MIIGVGLVPTIFIARSVLDTFNGYIDELNRDIVAREIIFATSNRVFAFQSSRVE